MSNNIKPLSNNVLFTFVDEVRDGMFFDMHNGLVVGKTIDGSTKEPRWGTVLAIGPDVNENDIQVGKRILIEPLRWTEALKVNGVKYWFTRVNEIMCVED